MSRWYIIHAYSGFENKVRDSIMAEATRLGLTPLVESSRCRPRRSPRSAAARRSPATANSSRATCSPSCSMSDDVYHLVKNTPKVTGFLGSMGKPQPISDAEAARILNTKDEAAAAAPKHRISVDYEIGDAVKVLDGPFASFNGVVEELDFEKSRVKVSVSHLRPRHARSSWSSSRSSGSNSRRDALTGIGKGRAKAPAFSFRAGRSL